MARARRKSDAVASFANRVESLPQIERTWEADFRALPQSLMQSETLYLGLVVNAGDGLLLAHSQVEGRPKPGDLATLLNSAMQQPLTGKAHRPNRLNVRGHRQWQQLFPALEGLGVQVSVCHELKNVKATYECHLKQLRETSRSKMTQPNKQQKGVEKLFPSIAKWVQGWGHIEIGDQEGFGFTVRAIDYGGLVFEDDRAETLAEAMAVLDQGLAEYFEREGIE